MPSYKLKSGDSIFKFDQNSDMFTLDLALDQQLYGPILLKSKATLNLDENSKSYGDFINSSLSINWKKRSYELGIFYQPHNQSGGIRAIIGESFAEIFYGNCIAIGIPCFTLSKELIKMLHG